MMAGNPSMSLLPRPLRLNDPIFRAICQWPFADGFVLRLLREDIPQRVAFGNGRIWAYLDNNRSIVGFGSIDVCGDHADLTQGIPHPHIPLLAVNPESQGRGYGKFIVEHLIGEAALLVRQRMGMCHDVLFLEVYEDNRRAISLYEEKCGFRKVKDEPILDPIEGKPYFIMARRVSIESK
jgi:ribosomal protein S18 acetylase RimI-like enzyme